MNLCYKTKKHHWQVRSKPIVNEIIRTLNSNDLLYTVRQFHYIMVERGYIENTKEGYHKVQNILKKGRRSGEIPWNRIVDETRTVFKTTAYKDMNEGLKLFLDSFRLDGRWSGKNGRIEVWIEKRTLYRQCKDITDKYDVYLNTGGGWTSDSAIWDAVQRFLLYNTNKVDIIYFGDLDPSGDDMPRDIEDRLNAFRRLGVDCTDGRTLKFPKEVKVHKILLTYDDLEKYHLEDRKRFDVQVKKGDKQWNKIMRDTRAKNMYDKYGEVFQVEMEALEPEIIKKVLEEEIKKYVNEKLFKETEKEEQEQVKWIRDLLDRNKRYTIKFDRDD